MSHDHASIFQSHRMCLYKCHLGILSPFLLICDVSGEEYEGAARRYPSKGNINQRSTPPLILHWFPLFDTLSMAILESFLVLLCLLMNDSSQ